MIPRHVTHVRFAKAVNLVRKRAFFEHPNIQEVICHEGVKSIRQRAFYKCPRLRRVILPGVKEVEKHAFYKCDALNYIECGKLEMIGEMAFRYCKSLNSVDLPSIKIVKSCAFHGCTNLTNAKFGTYLESIGDWAFKMCTSLERITLPLKDDMITSHNMCTFQGCKNLNHVDLVGGVQETIDTLLMEEWKDDMNEEINSISQILPNTRAGDECILGVRGGKADVIRRWIKSVYRKYNHYKAEHCHYLNVAAALEPALSNDIVLNNVLPFLSKSFGRGDWE